jgi:hypothetical protein
MAILDGLKYEQDMTRYPVGGFLEDSGPCVYIRITSAQAIFRSRKLSWWTMLKDQKWDTYFIMEDVDTLYRRSDSYWECNRQNTPPTRWTQIIFYVVAPTSWLGRLAPSRQNITLLRTSAIHPRTNGKTERRDRRIQCTTGNNIGKPLKSLKHKWDKSSAAAAGASNAGTRTKP